MSLEVKKQKTKNEWLFLRINYSKQCTRDVCSGWIASSKVRVKHLKVLKYEQKLWLKFLEISDIEKGTKHDFTACKTLSKVKPMYLEVNMKEAKFDW